MSISAVTSDAAGRVTSWKEGEYAFTVSRDAAGRPLFVRGVSPGRMQEGGEFRYLSSGAFSGFEGATGSVMLSALLRDATAGGAVPMLNKPDAFANLAALAAEDASKYAPGTIVRVGPFVDGQYSEWYTNGLRWRPRSSWVAVKNTPSILTDSGASEQDLYAFLIPAPLIGPNDNWFVEHLWNYPNSATTKTLRLKFGGTTIASLAATTTASGRGVTHIYMRDSKTSQIFSNASSSLAWQEGQTSSAAPVTGSVNTNVDVTIAATGQWGTAGAGSNLITLERIAIGVRFVF